MIFNEKEIYYSSNSVTNIDSLERPNSANQVPIASSLKSLYSPQMYLNSVWKRTTTA